MDNRRARNNTYRPERILRLLAALLELAPTDLDYCRINPGRWWHFRLRFSPAMPIRFTNLLDILLFERPTFGSPVVVKCDVDLRELRHLQYFQAAKSRDAERKIATFDGTFSTNPELYKAFSAAQHPAQSAKVSPGVAAAPASTPASTPQSSKNLSAPKRQQ